MRRVPGPGSRRSARIILVMSVLGLLLLFSGRPGAAGPAAAAAPAGPDAPRSTYLPLVLDDYLPATGRLCRYGIGAPWNIANYPVNRLHIGWYTDWGTALNPSRPGGIEYLQMVRLEQTGLTSYSSTPHGADLLKIIAAHPGSRWVIGNEPDRRTVQDSIEPQVYARAYHDLYYQIKAADPSARIVAGSIVQPTPLRLQYLDMILDTYRALYGEEMPVDIWNIHAFILNEVSCRCDSSNCWGADIPPGINACYGMRIDLEDTDNLDIFKQFIVDFRQWMADRGYQERPLIITEYGELMPEDYGFPPSRVNAYMNATFDYLSTATGPTGLTADKGRLVQAWAWYSLVDSTFNGRLFDEQTGARTVYGDNFAAYTSAVVAHVNLAPVRVWAEFGAEPGTAIGPGQAVRLVAQVANDGNISVTGLVRVRFYNGNPLQGGTPIGADQYLSAPAGCGTTEVVAVNWNSAPAGASTVWVVVDPLNEIAESDESDNRLTVTVTGKP